MAVNLVATVGLEIDQLKKKIAGASSQLVSLRNELKKRESIYLMLGERQENAKEVEEDGTRSASGNRGLEPGVKWCAEHVHHRPCGAKRWR